jgi:hypothetical protein
LLVVAYMLRHVYCLYMNLPEGSQRPPQLVAVLRPLIMGDEALVEYSALQREVKTSIELREPRKVFVHMVTDGELTLARNRSGLDGDVLEDGVLAGVDSSFFEELSGVKVHAIGALDAGRLALALDRHEQLIHDRLLILASLGLAPNAYGFRAALGPVRDASKVDSVRNKLAQILGAEVTLGPGHTKVLNTRKSPEQPPRPPDA